MYVSKAYVLQTILFEGKVAFVDICAHFEKTLSCYDQTSVIDSAVRCKGTINFLNYDVNNYSIHIFFIFFNVQKRVCCGFQRVL